MEWVKRSADVYLGSVEKFCLQHILIFKWKTLCTAVLCAVWDSGELCQMFVLSTLCRRKKTEYASTLHIFAFLIRISINCSLCLLSIDFCFRNCDGQKIMCLDWILPKDKRCNYSLKVLITRANRYLVWEKKKGIVFFILFAP